MNSQKKHYDSMDTLRTIACVGILMMHIATNNKYNISGFLYNDIIPSFTNFVFLFMAISAFGMCCGYYEKIQNNQISMSKFYEKRFAKVWPFFSLLVLLDAALSPSVSSLYEAFADLTLLFGFLPDAGNIEVIGVGWFLGTTFVFYLCFPFFCVLLETRKRAWLSFIVSLMYNFACSHYFHVGRKNILYSACFFLLGGLIYLYRAEIQKIKKPVGIAISAGAICLYYLFHGNAFMCLLVTAAILSTAIMCSNRESHAPKFTGFVSGISMEIYLSHMVIFRLIEKTGLNVRFGNGWLQYGITVVLVLTGSILFSVLMKEAIRKVLQK